MRLASRGQKGLARRSRHLGLALLALAPLVVAVSVAQAPSEPPASSSVQADTATEVTALADAIRQILQDETLAFRGATDIVRIAAEQARKLSIDDLGSVAAALLQVASDPNRAPRLAAQMRLAAALINGDSLPKEVTAPPKQPDVLLPASSDPKLVTDAPVSETEGPVVGGSKPQPNAPETEPTPGSETTDAPPERPVTGTTLPGPSQPLEPRTETPTEAEPIVTPEGERALGQSAPKVDLSSLETRAAAYNRPTQMRLNRPVDVSFVIDATANPNPTAPLEGFPGEVIETDIDTTDRVVATLTGVNFSVESQTLERQVLSPFQPNRWQWQVTPTADGEQVLILEVFAFPAGSEDALPIRTYRDRITVAVEDQEKIVNFARSWQPVIALIAAILSGLVAGLGLWSFYKRRRAEKLAAAAAAVPPAKPVSPPPPPA